MFQPPIGSYSNVKFYEQFNNGGFAPEFNVSMLKENAKESAKDGSLKRAPK